MRYLRIWIAASILGLGGCGGPIEEPVAPVDSQDPALKPAYIQSCRDECQGDNDPDCYYCCVHGCRHPGSVSRCCV